VAVAIALSVALADTVTGPVYCGELLVGVLPLVVYRTTAPGVVELMTTDCAPL
jgi:hypothetical protein